MEQTRKATKKREPRQALKLRSSWRGALYEPTTWAGLATVIGAVATGGVTGLADPAVLGQIAAGLGLIALREVKEGS